MRKPRLSIVIRLMAMSSLLVFSMALALYFVLGYGAARAREAEQQARIRFLAKSISFGIRNFVVTNREDLIREVVFEALNRNNDPEIVVVECRVRNRQGHTVFRFTDPARTAAPVNSVGYDVIHKSGGESFVIGRITLGYYARDSLESEKTRRIITIGNTLGAMFQVFYKNKALFQAKELVDTVQQDKNILYCIIAGNNGQVHFSYQGERGGLEKYLTKDKQRRAMSVNHAKPIVIQDIARTALDGRVIEAAILIEQGDRKLGVVRVGYSLRSWSERLAKTRATTAMVIAAFILLAVAMSYSLSRSITGPILRLTQVSRGVSAQAPSQEVDIAEAEREMQRLADSFESIAARLRSRNDEVGGLAESFSQMIAALRTRAHELRLAYQKMGQADRLFAMGQLSAGIAHEINNPLAIISTYVQIIDKRQDLDEELKGEIKIISEEIQRIAEKVKDLLSFAQDPEIRFSPADIGDVARRTLNLMRHQLKKSSIALVDEIGDGAPVVAVCDANKIKQVVLNLALNAMQAMDSGGTLTVGLRESADSAALYVRDTGHGISEQDMPEIFNPFFTRRRVGEGTGMGLAICYNIVQAHGGEIEVRSAPGQGTEFVVHLPKEQPPAK